LLLAGAFAAATPGEVLLSVLLEFWLTDAGEPLPPEPLVVPAASRAGSPTPQLLANSAMGGMAAAGLGVPSAAGGAANVTASAGGWSGSLAGAMPNGLGAGNPAGSLAGVGFGSISPGSMGGYGDPAAVAAAAGLVGQGAGALMMLGSSAGGAAGVAGSLNSAAAGLNAAGMSTGGSYPGMSGMNGGRLSAGGAMSFGGGVGLVGSDRLSLAGGLGLGAMSAGGALLAAGAPLLSTYSYQTPTEDLLQVLLIQLLKQFCSVHLPLCLCGWFDRSHLSQFGRLMLPLRYSHYWLLLEVPITQQGMIMWFIVALSVCW
jgi:hypothetical protein